MPSTAVAGNIGDFFVGINRLMTVDCPSNTEVVYPEYPPFGDDWEKTEAAAWKADQPALALLRTARSIQQPSWPPGELPTNRQLRSNYLNAMRNVAVHAGDAALYLHVKGDDAAACEQLRDTLVISELLEHTPCNSQVRLLVSGGIRALVAERFMVIESNIALTTDPAERQKLQVSAARKLITQFLAETITPAQWETAMHTAEPGMANMDPSMSGRALETFNRVNTEQAFAAMSMACHLFLFDQHRWPNSIDELVPGYLPHRTIDPWGDAKQTLEYVLVKGGLPDGSDRPMVYSRCNAKRGLFYRTDVPAYWFYMGRPRDPDPVLREIGGEFRDVACWHPAAGAGDKPTTRPLQ